MLTALFIQHDQGFHPDLVALQTSRSCQLGKPCVNPHHVTMA